MRSLSCDELSFLLGDLLAGEIEPAGADAVQAHLAGCAHCRSEVEELAWLDRVLAERAAYTNLRQLAASVHAALVQRGGEESSPRVVSHNGAIIPSLPQSVTQPRDIDPAAPLLTPANRTAPPRSATSRLFLWLAVTAASIVLAVGTWLPFFRQDHGQPESPPAIQVERLQGEVHILSGEDRERARPEQRLLADEGLQTAGEGSLAVVKYADGTLLELGPDTTVDRLVSEDESRKKVVLRQGVLTLDVTKQPEDRPLILVSTHAEMVVRGTRFSCSTAADSTTIRVEEGRVQFTRRSDGKSIDVEAGQMAYANAAPIPPVIEPFAPRTMPPSSTAVRTTLQDQTRPLFFVSYSPDGTMLASAGRRSVKVWDVVAEKVKFDLSGHTEDVRCAVFSPDSRILATTSDDRFVRLWDLSSGKQRLLLKGHRGRVNSAAFSPDGQTLATGSGHWNEIGEVFLWNVTTGERQAAVEGHKRGVLAVAFSPDGKTLASASHDNTVKLWDLATGKERRTLRGHRDGVASVAFSPDGRRLVTAGRFHDRTVRLWDEASGKELASLTGHLHSINRVLFSPDGRLLASCADDKTVILWDIALRKERATLKGHNNAVTSIAFSPDGKTLATVAAWDRVINLWDVFPEGEEP